MDVDDDDYLCEAALLAVLNDDDDEDEEEDDVGAQQVYVDIEGWRRLDGMCFRRNFRMRKATFQKLIFEVGHHLRWKGKLRWSRTPLDVILMYATWAIFNPDCFRSIGTTFGKASSTMHHHYAYMVATICELADKYKRWPSGPERTYISIQFEQRYSYPGVAGCIDSTFFEVTAPLDNKLAHLTRHHSYAHNCQAVCDHNLLIRDVYMGVAGSVGDRRTFVNSPIYEALLRSPDALSDDQHLLGDCAYPLSKQILTPYINDGNLSRRRRKHNYELSRVRASIERCFALLFGRMRRSKHHHTYSWPITIDHGMAAVVLHNFVIVHEVLDEVELNYFENAAPLQNYVEGPEDELLRESALIGALKREYIASLFPVNDP